MMIANEKMMLYNFIKYLEKEESNELVARLQGLHSSLEQCNRIETLFLQLLADNNGMDKLVRLSRISQVCSLLVTSINSMNRPHLKSILLASCLQFMDYPSLREPLYEDLSNTVLRRVPRLTFIERYQKGTGACLIINQEIFENSEMNRTGSNKDRDLLKNTFTLLGVNKEMMIVHNNLTDLHMRENIEDFARLVNGR